MKNPLLKNLPVLMAVLVLWMARPASASFAIKQIDDAQRHPRSARTSWA